MKEHIYTIPVNEAFEVGKGCPICRLFDRYEADAVDHILGDAMMQPGIRIVTNKTGFCSDHYTQMFSGKNRLGLALILQSHLDEVNGKLFKKSSPFSSAPDSNKTASYLNGLNGSCYVCDRVRGHMELVMTTVYHLWNSENKFREIAGAQEFYCLHHYEALAGGCAKNVSKNLQKSFMETLSKVQQSYADSLSEDIDWFCRKFDYRNKDEPWNNSKDAVERVIAFLEKPIK